jgi:hypothetical protein
VRFQPANLCQVLSNGVPILDLTIEEGSTFSEDRAGLIRSTCSLLLTDPTGDLVASTANDVLTPFGNELAVYRGENYDDGTQELILLGIFQIVDRFVDDSGGDLTITLDGADRARAIQRDTFTDVFVIPPNTNVGLAIQSIILSRNISPLAQQFNFAPTTFTTPSTPIVYSAGDDPLAAIADPNTGLAASIGMAFFYDPNGIATLAPIPDPNEQPVTWPYDDGPGTLVTDLQPSVDSAKAYSMWVRDFAGTSGLPVQGVAQDTNPASETWIGTYGEVVDYQPSSIATTQAQVQVQANAAKLANLGAARAIVITAYPKPDNHVDSVFEATRIRAGVAPGSLFVMDSQVMGLGTSGLQQMTCRSVVPLS